MPTRSQLEVLHYELEKELATALAKAGLGELGVDIYYGRFPAETTVKGILVRCTPGPRGPLSMPGVLIRVRGKNMDEVKVPMAKITELFDHKRPVLVTINAYLRKVESEEQVRNEINRVDIPMQFQTWCSPKAGVALTA